MPDNRKELLELLNRALSVEYGALFLLPTHIALVQDEELKRQLRLIQGVELEHAEKTAQLIYALGGAPNADLPRLQPRTDLRAVLESAIAGEQTAIDIYTRGAALSQDPAIRQTLAELLREEEGHLSWLQRALARLGPAT